MNLFTTGPGKTPRGSIDGRTLLTVAIVAPLSLYAVAMVLLDSGNQIANLCFFMLIGGGLLGILSPASGFYTWLLICGYIDLVKRFMAVSGRISFMDLYFVLGVPPVMFSGILAGIFAGTLTGSIRLSSADLKRFAAGVLAMCGAAFIAFKNSGGSIKSALPDVANGGLYAMLIFVVPVLFPTLQSLLKLLRFIVIAYLPVAVYGVIQQFTGFQEFEIEYLMTGLSIEIKQLMANELRAFSTLNSPTALGFVCAYFMALAMFLAYMWRRRQGMVRFPTLAAFFMVLVYTGGMLSSATRASTLVMVVGLAGFVCFRSVGLTRALYATMVAAFVLLVTCSKWLLANLDRGMEFTFRLAGGEGFALQWLRVGTYKERLIGFGNVLSNPDAYSLFGYGKERGKDDADPLLNHDLISNILVQHGVVVLILTVAACALLLWHVHRTVLRMPPGPERNFGAGILSLSLGFLVASALAGNVLAIFPVNVFFWMGFAAIETLAPRQDEETAPAPQARQPIRGCDPRLWQPPIAARAGR